METKEEVQNAVAVEIKPKRERTEKQILSFEKARMVLLEKQKAKLDAIALALEPVLWEILKEIEEE